MQREGETVMKCESRQSGRNVGSRFSFIILSGKICRQISLGLFFSWKTDFNVEVGNYVVALYIHTNTIMCSFINMAGPGSCSCQKEEREWRKEL